MKDYVSAIRCRDCHRLRKHPDSGRITCSCGSLRFVPTVPHDDEMPLAMNLYAKEIADVISEFPERAKDL